MADTVDRWMREAATTERVPAHLDQHLAEEPPTKILAGAGFTILGEFEFTTPYEWSVEKLTGFMYSTSILSQQALGRNVAAFERDLRARLLAVEPKGLFREDISFAYTLAQRP